MNKITTKFTAFSPKAKAKITFCGDCLTKTIHIQWHDIGHNKQPTLLLATYIISKDVLSQEINSNHRIITTLN